MSHSIVVTSAGRRTSLVKFFVAAARQRGWRVLGVDIDPLAPALFLADAAHRAPRVTSTDYVPFLFDLVERESVRMIVPTIDTELQVLAENRELLAKAGCTALVSLPELVRISGDKWLTVTEFGKRGVRVPQSWLPGEYDAASLPEKLFLKPRDGSASQHTHRVSKQRLEQVLPQVPNAIIQEELQGPEITIDALVGLDGTPLHYVPRTRIRTLGGESIQGVTINDDNGLGEWLVNALRICSELGGRGPLTLQAFLTPDGPVLSEINPRFGGGFPLTYAAGGKYPDWLLEALEGATLAPRFGEYQRGLYMTRYYVEHFSESPLWER